MSHEFKSEEHIGRTPASLFTITWKSFRCQGIDGDAAARPRQSVRAGLRVEKNRNRSNKACSNYSRYGSNYQFAAPH